MMKNDPLTSKTIIDLKDIDRILPSLKNFKTVLVGGCFDVLHFGHIVFLEKAREQGDRLIVALEPDEFILKNKKRQPIHDQEQRAKVLASLKMVNMVVKLPLFKSGADYLELIKKIRPSVIAVTEGDYQIENKKKQANFVGAKLKIVTPRLEKFASSKIIK